MILDHAPSHTRPIFNIQSFPIMVDWVVKAARRIGVDALAACGHSGLIVAGAAAYVLKIPVIAVRKKDQIPASDDGRLVNAFLDVKKAIEYGFVDDLVDEGKTYRHVTTAIDRELGPTIKCGAVFLYNGEDYSRLWAERRCPGVPVYLRIGDKRL